MLYLSAFVIAFFGALSGNFCKLGERNIGNAGGPAALIVPQLFGPALLISFITGFAPLIAIPFIGFSIGWLEALYALFITILGAFICGFVPFSIRHIVVLLSPFFIGWGFYQIWIYYPY